MNPNSIVNALTIDVEDYFQVHAFSNTIRVEEWDSYESRIESNTFHILDVLDSYDVPQITDDGQATSRQRATFFILGWIAERYPHLVKEIHARGHEVACHGYAHMLILNQSKEEFREDVMRAKGILEELTGCPITGYRAPTYSITRKTLWALEILHELGFQYDSSIFPIKHDVYGVPSAPRFPFAVSLDNKNGLEFELLQNVNTVLDRFIIECPLATWSILGYNIPIAGGGYFRLFPYFVTKSFLRRINKREDSPFVFYVHPWEFDVHFPKIPNSNRFSRFRTYLNLKKTESRFKELLSDFSFSRMDLVIQTLLSS